MAAAGNRHQSQFFRICVNQSRTEQMHRLFHYVYQHLGIQPIPRQPRQQVIQLDSQQPRPPLRANQAKRVPSYGTLPRPTPHQPRPRGLSVGKPTCNVQPARWATNFVSPGHESLQHQAPHPPASLQAADVTKLSMPKNTNSNGPHLQKRQEHVASPCALQCTLVTCDNLRIARIPGSQKHLALRINQLCHTQSQTNHADDLYRPANQRYADDQPNHQ